MAVKLHDAAKTFTAAHVDSTTELLIKQKVDAILRESQTHDELGEIVENAVSIFDAAWDLINRLNLEAPLLKKENCTV